MKRVFLLMGTTAMAAVLVVPVTKAQTFTITISTSASCFTPCTGSATFTFNTTSSPITYTISGPSYTTGVTSSSILTVNNLCPGVYNIMAMAGMTGFGTGSFSINVISPPVVTNVTYSPASPPPFLYNATATISGGNAPYYVTWYQFNGVSYLPIKNHTVNVSQDTAFLYPGDYSVTVTDANNIAAGCSGGVGYQFSICDNGVGSGVISIQPNDTVCVNTTFTVSYIPMLFGPVNIVGYNYSSSYSGCQPTNVMGPYETFSCSVSTPTTINFNGFWVYAMGCMPITFPTATLVVDACLNTNELKLVKDIDIVPNPSNGTFRITMKDVFADKMKYEISDITGKIVYKNEIKNGEYISIQLNAGIYYIRCYLDNETIERKLIILNE